MSPNLALPTEIEQFFEEIELSALPVDQKMAILHQLETAAREQVMALILENLSLEDQTALGKIVQGASGQEAILDFLRERISDLEGQVGEQVRAFKQSIISDVKQALGQQTDPTLREKITTQIRDLLQEGKFAEIRQRFLDQK